MAIIHSITIGKGRKSLGNVTLQNYYGKTVAKQKIVANPNYVPTAAQLKQRRYFTPMAHLAGAYNPLIRQTYVRSKNGSAYNNFYKTNYNSVKEVFFSPAYGPVYQSSIIPDAGHVMGVLQWFAAMNENISDSEGQGEIAAVPFLQLCRGTSAAFQKISIGLDQKISGTSATFSVTNASLSIVDSNYKRVSAKFFLGYTDTPFAQVQAWNNNRNDIFTISSEIPFVLGESGLWEIEEAKTDAELTIELVNNTTLVMFAIVSIDSNPVTVTMPHVGWSTVGLKDGSEDSPAPAEALAAVYTVQKS